MPRLRGFAPLARPPRDVKARVFEHRRVFGEVLALLLRKRRRPGLAGRRVWIVGGDRGNFILWGCHRSNRRRGWVLAAARVHGSAGMEGTLFYGVSRAGRSPNVPFLKRWKARKWLPISRLQLRKAWRRSAACLLLAGPAAIARGSPLTQRDIFEKDPGNMALQCFSRPSAPPGADDEAGRAGILAPLA